MRASVRDTQLYFDVEGSELRIVGTQIQKQPVIFALHGGPGVDHMSLRPTLTPLSDIAQLIYIDHRGQGRSARGPKSSYTLDNNIEDLEALRQHLGLEQIGLLGFSYGGMVALAYGVRYPQHLAALAVVATAPDARFLAKAQQRLAEIGSPEQQAIAQHLWAGSFVDAAHLQRYFEMMGSLYSLHYDPIAAAESWQRIQPSVDAINEAFGGFLRQYSVTHQLHRITCPTLVIGAQQDWICDPSFSAEIAAAIPHAELVIVDPSGHSIRADAPEILLHHLKQFFGTATVGA